MIINNNKNITTYLQFYLKLLTNINKLKCFINNKEKSK